LANSVPPVLRCLGVSVVRHAACTAAARRAAHSGATLRNILFISNQYTPNVYGGAEIITQNLVEELARRGNRVSVVSIAPSGVASEDFVNGVKVYRVPVANVYAPFTGEQRALTRALWHVIDSYNVTMGARVGKILAHERPDWVCANNIAGFSVSVWTEAKRRGIRTCQVLHDYYALCPRSRMNSDRGNCTKQCGQCKVYAAPRKLASSAPELVVGVSRFVLNRHLEYGYFKNAKTAVVYNGADFTPPVAIRKRQQGAPIALGFIGRIEPSKGIETLLKALSQVDPSKWSLRIAGRATEQSYLERLQRTYPFSNVEYLGFTKSDEFYRSVDLVIIPSEWNEPLPGVVYEPLGYGIPVVASRIGGIPEILGDAECGWLFEPSDAGDLARVLNQLVDGWADPDGVAARALQRRQFFTPMRQADEMTALLASFDAPA
jgi:glycosyltransferase involved in cell wall biosynthesis